MEEKKDINEKQIVVFDLANEEFGVNINEVREIIRMEQITKIPNTAPFIKGVINLRGGIIVVIDLAMKLGLPKKEIDKNTRILVVEIGSNTVGMIVESATEVLRLTNEEIEPAPPIITQKINADYIDGVGIIGERLLVLLDLAKVIGNDEMEHVMNVQQNAGNMPPPPKEEVKAEENVPIEEAPTENASEESEQVENIPFQEENAPVKEEEPKTDTIPEQKSEEENSILKESQETLQAAHDAINK